MNTAARQLRKIKSRIQERNNKTSCSGEKNIEGERETGTGLESRRNDETKVETRAVTVQHD